MTIEEAIKILKDHNKWRRGADMPMTDPKILGEAIDCVVDANVEIVAQSYGKGFAQGQEVGERETIERAYKTYCMECAIYPLCSQKGVFACPDIDSFKKAMEN